MCFSLVSMQRQGINWSFGILGHIGLKILVENHFWGETCVLRDVCASAPFFCLNGGHSFLEASGNIFLILS